MNQMKAVHWIYVRWAEGEQLYRARLAGPKGETPLPGRKEILKYEWSDSGKVSLQVDGAQTIKFFPEGSVLIRSSEKRAPVLATKTNSSTWIGLVTAFALAMLGYQNYEQFFSIRNVQQVVSAQKISGEKARKSQRVERKAGTSKRVIKTGTVKATSKATNGTPRVVQGTSWTGLTRKVRAEFSKGNLDRTEELLEELREKHHDQLSRPLRAIYSEVKYAKCRRGFNQQEWRDAVRWCEEALRLSFHLKAKKILDQLGAQARRLYLEGYVMEASNPVAAVKRYRQSAACAPSNSPYREKARGKLKSIKVVASD